MKYEKNIVFNHGLAWKRYPLSFSNKFRMWYNFLIPRILKEAHLIFVVSQFNKEELIEEFKIEENKIKILYPGISEKFKFMNLKRENFILYVGNIQPYKNLKNLFKAFQILRRNGREIELWIVGIKDKRVFKNEEFREFNFQGVKFLGYKEDQELLELYNKAQSLVLPSFYETFGFPLLEAMACGCPVIASKIPALLEIAQDSALFINPHKPEEIANGLEEILDNQNLRENLIQKGFKRVEKFRWNYAIKTFLTTLKDFNLL
ncbi:MAG: glycosyltransferase family 4 protein [Thermodesulfobacteriaceae bacterium]|nr:glycosyltransferase family 4 protein [Thermodesulfobacteriaceae bacterium]MCX8041941.1 glycosyltransferase family 4 protein [Thermodesulfobacteriaceae bacterium]MDW8136252.1 glycosyltransferase family 1 protein [Thermodesulfobacterium sp.]